MNIVFRSLSVGLCLGASFAATNLSAAEYVSRNIKVPFAFTVGKVTLPAGEYRVRQEAGKEIVSIVNVRTMRSVRILRDSSQHVPGRTKLTFQPSEQGYRLSQVF
jgi:hypothetical protein